MDIACGFASLVHENTTRGPSIGVYDDHGGSEGFDGTSSLGRSTWVRPRVVDEVVLWIEEGRHPVLEKELSSRARRCTPNSCLLSTAKQVTNNFNTTTNSRTENENNNTTKQTDNNFNTTTNSKPENNNITKQAKEATAPTTNSRTENITSNQTKHTSPTNTRVSEQEKNIWILTGPNMGGKSTFLRQNAQLIVMAQMGCYVPAKQAVVGVVDQLFSRVGSSDDVMRNQSSFMVEMTETGNTV